VTDISAIFSAIILYGSDIKASIREMEERNNETREKKGKKNKINKKKRYT